jgi:predicted HTH transcriptional regulator
MDKSLLCILEDHLVDFKVKLDKPVNIAKTLVAFANGKGGRLIIGVDDKTREPVGIDEERLYEMEEWISNVTYSHCQPVIRPYLSIEHCEDKVLLIVTIYPGTSKPYHLKGQAPDQSTYIRVGFSNRLADIPTIRELERQALNISFDEQIFRLAGINALETPIIQKYLEIREQKRHIPSEKVDVNLLAKLKVIAREAGSFYPTYGGLLLYSSDPTEYLPKSQIRCARLKGTKSDEFIDKLDLKGPVLEVINETIKFVKRNIRLGARVNGVYLEEQYEYPIEAVREAVINAAVHRDYSIDSDIRLAIYDDCIELSSPGLLPTNISIENLGNGASVVRNRVLARNLKEMALFEEWGRGTRIIKDRMHNWGLNVEFAEVNRDFRVTFWGKGIASDTKLSSRQLDLIKKMTPGEIFTSKDFMDKYGVSHVTANKDLKELVSLGLLIQQGQGKTTAYHKA